MSNLTRSAVAAALLSVSASAATAQASEPAASSASAVSVAPAATPLYRSAFDGYKGHAEQPVGSWQKANDVVGRIGGWQAYAREAQGKGQTGGAELPVPASHGGMHTQPTGNPSMPKLPAATSPRSPTLPAKAPPSQPASSAARGATAEGGASGHGGSHTEMKKP